MSIIDISAINGVRSMATNVHLTPELDRFARESVEGGRYNNVSEVVWSALRIMQETEDRHLALTNMLLAAREGSN